MPDKGWHCAFDDPIPLPCGGKLITLRDAATLITKLPKAEHDAPEWRAGKLESFLAEWDTEDIEKTRTAA